MAHEIIIDFETEPGAPSLFHQVRNFGEDLYRLFKDDGCASISIEDVDRATNQLRVTVRSKRRVRRVVSMIENLLERHFLTNRDRVSEIATPE